MSEEELETPEMIAARKQAKVMTAYADGKEIEAFIEGADEWQECRYPSWNWGDCRFRVKPREWYVMVAPEGSRMHLTAEAARNDPENKFHHILAKVTEVANDD